MTAKTGFFLHGLANPETFSRIASALQPWFFAAAALLIGSGLYFGLFNSPQDYQQGDTVRIMYVHVPAAWTALFAYTFLASASASSFIWRHALADFAARAAAPVGAAFTFLAIVTGALWGKPMWGAWWVWDARLTSVLILLFLFLGYMAVWRAIEDETKAARAAAILAMVGFVNIPIIKFSVDWWNSLHQPASVARFGAPKVDPSMLTPLLLMGAGYLVLFAGLVLLRTRTEILERKIRRLRQAQAYMPAARATFTAPAEDSGPAPDASKA